MGAQGRFFPGVHALRAVAAMSVLVAHSLFVASGSKIIWEYDYLGRTGVVLFFAISGFVIALQRSKPVGEFIKHRALRIYPGFWIALALEAALFTATGFPVGFRAATFLLYPEIPPGLVTAIPYWTLTFEVTFYYVAAVLFALRLSDRTLTLIAALWIVAVQVLGSNPANAAQYAFPGSAILWSPAMQVLPLGLICGIHFDHLRQAGRGMWIILAVIGFAASFLVQDMSKLQFLMLGIGSASLILSVADCAVPHVLRRLGDASYGIYLIHFPILVVLSSSLGLVGLVAVATICGTLYGLFDFRLYGFLVDVDRRRHQGVRTMA